jgi:hypothetical protein
MPKYVPTPIKSVQHEPWGRVVLENGAVITFRFVLNQAYQIFNDDGSPMQDEHGEYQFGINVNTLVSIEQQPVAKKEMN